MSNYDNLDLVILKTLLTNKKYALDFANDFDVTKQQFFSNELWNFSNLILGYIKTFKELPTLRIVTERLNKSNNDKLIENVKNIWECIDQISYDDKEYKHDLEKLKKRYAEKQINKLSLDSSDISKSISDMQRAIQNIKALNQAKTYDRKTLKEAVPIFRDEYNAKLENPHFDQGLKTGYSYLDYATDGLRPGELLLIGAESGGGKSMLLMNMAIQLWLQENKVDPDETNFKPGNDVLYFSLEMPFKPCLNRVLSRLSGNPSKLIRNAKLNPEEAIKLKKTLKFLSKYPHQFEIVDIPRGATMESLELIFEESKTQYNPKVVVIDYLGLMDYEGGNNLDDWLKLGKIAEKIHEFARVHNCIVLSAVQLNRAKGKDVEEKIGLHRVGRSALILQNANIAIQIETRANEKQYPDMMYHIIKNRDGALGSGKLIKNLACGTLVDYLIKEDETEFYDRDPNDISGKIDLLDI